jgi:hypothetical protein
VSSRAASVRSSAGVFASTARELHGKQTCAAMHDPLDSVGTLAGRLVADPSLGRRLSPQVTAAVASLGRAAAGSSAEWQAVLSAAGDLGRAVHDANETTVRLTASQVVLAVRLAQAGCAVAGR